MKAIKFPYKVLLFLLIVISCSCMVQRPFSQRQMSQRQGGNISVQIFYDQLSPYGHWVHNREYGYVWIPDVGRNFYPYASDGRWLMTDYGWTWVSDYKWGWAPFHYGRWDYDPYYGWFWFPDNEWGPAWVTWRSGNGYYGWAPMRPGMNASVNIQSRYIDTDRWIFIRERDFGRTNPERYLVNRRNNDEIVRNSAIINNVRIDNQRRVTYITGPDPSEIQRVTRRSVNNVSVRDYDRPGTRLSNNQLQIYRPRVDKDNSTGQRPAPSIITDMKEIRPVRERSRNYDNTVQQSDSRRNNQIQRQGQGQQEIENQNQIQNENRRRNQQQLENRNQREIQKDQQNQQREIKRQEQDRHQLEKQQMDEVQKRQIQQQRENRRQSEAADSSRRKTERQINMKAASKRRTTSSID